MKNLSHKDLPIEVQSLLSEEQKRLIDRGICLGNSFLITGPQGPTGKTTLTNALCDLGLRAVEPWDLVEITLSVCLVPDTHHQANIQGEKKMNDNELVEIKKEVQNIRLLLEFLFVPEHETKHVDGKRVRNPRSHEALLKQLRKDRNMPE